MNILQYFEQFRCESSGFFFKGEVVTLFAMSCHKSGRNYWIGFGKFVKSQKGDNSQFVLLIINKLQKTFYVQWYFYFDSENE